MNTRAFILSAFLAGLGIAFLGNVPVINFFNCFLCMWVWLGGIFAVFLYRRFYSSNPALAVGQAAGLGAAAGVFAALIGAVFSALMNALFAQFRVIQALESLSNQPGMESFIKMVSSGGFPIINLLINLVLYSIFGAVGGVIAAAAIWKAPKSA